MSSPKSIFTVPEQLRSSSSQPSLKLPPSGRRSASDHRDICTLALNSHRNTAARSFSPVACGGDRVIEPTSTQGLAPPPSSIVNRSATYGQTGPVAGLKRPFEYPLGDTSYGGSDSFPKRSRLRHLYQHTLDHFDFPVPPPDFSQPTSSNQPPSPLFFSNSSSKRPPFPPRFSSGEAGARMLRQADAEESKVKTVTLARVTYSGSSPPATVGVPSYRSSLERTSIAGATSPETEDRRDASRILTQVGITELLEQDPRPTFIVDLTESLNYSLGPLRILFANVALRTNPALYEAILGRGADASPRTEPLKGISHFKAWLFSATLNGESLEVCLPAFVHGGVSWSCSTIRRRLRVVSASAALSTPASASMSGIPSGFSVPLPASGSAPHTTSSSSLRHIHEEPQDYFGDAVPSPAETTRGTQDRNVVESIETQTPPRPLIVARNGFLPRNEVDASFSDTSVSFANECVLSAAAAGSIDRFHSPQQEIGFFDWTRLPLSDNLPHHIKFARSVDWASTSLGPIELWPSDLRQMCNLIMASPHPAAMYWGEDLVAIYNEAYVLLAGQKHPNLMGQRYRDAWSEIWDDVKDVFTNARLTGQATMKDDDCLFMKRSSYLEETYFSWSIIPMVGGDGTVSGLYNPAFEKTRRKIVERRMLTLREIGERTATARDVKGFWKLVGEALDSNPFDTPFVLLYSVSDDSDSDSSSIHSSSLLGTKQAFLEGSLGVPNGHPAAPEQLELKTSQEGFGPVFREVMKTDKPVLLKVAGTEDDEPVTGYDFDGSSLTHEAVATETGPELEATMLDGIDFRGFGDPCRAVVVCPVHPTTGESTLGFLVLGVNPRRPYDDDYSLFIQLLSRQLATSLASVVLFEEEIRRGQKAAKLAALDRIELSQQLAIRTQEARDSETRFTRMAELSPAALFIADSQGQITYCNDTWYEITRVPKDSKSTDRWIEAVNGEDQTRVKELWFDLVEHCKPVTAEFRFKAQWRDRNGNTSDTWVLFSAYPEKHTADTPGAAEGTLKSVFGSLTNISQQKWAEGFQKRKTEEAVELKRQQENFIDITSHEMRNPLSAILQCADEISTQLSGFQESKSQNIEPDLVSNSIDAAQTIMLCAQHQKQIVDDVLTLSKLDSHMLMVTPIDVQPVSIIQRALKMHENEIRNADIDMRFIVNDSFRRLDIDWVRVDPQRVLQVLINLTGNAIKFTTGANKREITVTISAFEERPSLNAQQLDYFPSRKRDVDAVMGPDWGNGQEVYIHFAVQDTGRGLSAEEKKMLFMRFSQASPRTHIQYGGSGLGLFISRELTELQGGEIGVASEAGKGSTFAFYIKARRSTEPSDPDEQFPALVKTVTQDVKSKRPGSVKTRDFAPITVSYPGQTKEKKDITVLVVEDNLVNQRVLQKQLKNIGFTVEVANHGGECLDRIRESQFWNANQPAPETKHDTSPISVILMDQEMPVMDGLQCTKTIREWEQNRMLIAHVPIIGVTANARAEQIQTLLIAGMDDVVSKPFRIPEIVPKIEEINAKFPWPPQLTKSSASTTTSSSTTSSSTGR